MSSDETMQQTIMNNCNFQYKGNKLFFKNWNTCGMLHVKNLFNEKSNFKLRHLWNMETEKISQIGYVNIKFFQCF